MLKKIGHLVLWGALLASQSAHAQTYPELKPVKIIAAFTAGSATDISARIVGEILRAELKANVVVENKPGAQGIIGTESAVKSAPDGYTLTITSTSLNSINPGLFKKLPYDPLKDFSHVIRLTTMPVLLLVRTDSPYKTLQELVSAGKGGKLNYGYGSPGGQVSAVAFNSAARISSVGASYKSQPQALTDLAGGIVDYVLADLSVSTALLKAGRIRALATSSPQRLAEWKDVPTFAELGYKDYDLVTWVGLGGPAGMPKEVVQKLNAVIHAALSKPEVKEKFHTLGMQAAPNSVEEQELFVKTQLGIWQNRMTEARIQPE